MACVLRENSRPLYLDRRLKRKRRPRKRLGSKVRKLGRVGGAVGEEQVVSCLQVALRGILVSGWPSDLDERPFLELR